MLLKQVTASLGLVALLVLPLASCSNTPAAKSIQDAVAADPKLNNTSNGSTPTAQLPAKFPAEVPKYPNATLLDAQSTSQASVSAGRNSAGTDTSTDLVTRWSSSDSRDQIINFYRQELQKNDWQLDAQSNQTSVIATRNGLKVAVNVQPNAQTGTNFTIQTQASGGQTAQAPKPGDQNFVGPVPPASPAPNASSADAFSDFNKAPQQLQQYARDLAQLGVITASNNKSNALNLFEPNQNINRRTYARWLVAANNRIYQSRPARQIRLGVESSPPAFRDVEAKDPDFPAIQGLAEAGLIPSPLSGDSTAVLFRPDAPLSREDLILWKIPVDTRQGLPNATIEAVKQTWGFQDTARIDSKALRAILADYQNGDQANIRRAFGYTTLFQPKRPVTRAEAAAVLWYFGFQGDGLSAQDALKGGNR